MVCSLCLRVYQVAVSTLASWLEPRETVATSGHHAATALEPSFLRTSTPIVVTNGQRLGPPALGRCLESRGSPSNNRSRLDHLTCLTNRWPRCRQARLLRELWKFFCSAVRIP